MRLRLLNRRLHAGLISPFGLAGMSSGHGSRLPLAYFLQQHVQPVLLDDLGDGCMVDVGGDWFGVFCDDPCGRRYLPSLL